MARSEPEGVHGQPNPPLCAYGCSRTELFAGARAIGKLAPATALAMHDFCLRLGGAWCVRRATHVPFPRGVGAPVVTAAVEASCGGPARRISGSAQRRGTEHAQAGRQRQRAWALRLKTEVRCGVVSAPRGSDSSYHNMRGVIRAPASDSLTCCRAWGGRTCVRGEGCEYGQRSPAARHRLRARLCASFIGY